jgi:hypothetical protein
MDEKWEPYWHVFLGKSFGCHSVHERNRFVYFTFEPSKISFLIYKASWTLRHLFGHGLDTFMTAWKEEIVAEDLYAEMMMTF